MKNRRERVSAIRLFTWMQLISSAIAQLFTIWFWSVVYEAWQYMRNEMPITPLTGGGTTAHYGV